VLAFLALALVPALAAYRKARGVRLITCPETHDYEAVELDAGLAALSAAVGARVAELRSCTRWPERADCEQLCLAQIQAAPDGCRVRSLLEAWYAGESCALCGEPFPPFHAWDHKPALMSPDRVTREWSEVAPLELPQVLATHLPVCWNCHIVESLYRTQPELPIERPWEWDRPGYHSRPPAA
jgi:hypothetical protein